MEVHLWIVPMNMGMHILAMTVRVLMDDSAMAVGRHEPVGYPLRHTRQIKHAEENEHQAHRQFHSETNARRNHQVEQNDRRTYEQNRNGVSQAPEYSDQACMPDAPLPTHNGGHGNHMVRVGSMADSQQEPDANHCQQVDHFESTLNSPRSKSKLNSHPDLQNSAGHQGP